MALEGVAAMVRAAVWLENRGRLETLNIGPGDLDRKDSCTLELAGRHLFYSVLLDGGFVFLSAQSMLDDVAVGIEEEKLRVTGGAVAAQIAPSRTGSLKRDAVRISCLGLQSGLCRVLVAPTLLLLRRRILQFPQE